MNYNKGRSQVSKFLVSEDMMNQLDTYFERFFEEKELPFQRWEIDTGKNVHYIDSNVVIESIKNAPIGEQREIRNILVAIDFKNGDVNHFLKHLATALANMHDGIPAH